MVLVDKHAFLIFFGLLIVLYLAVFVVVQGITGASPGKALLRIRVIRSDGRPPGVLRSTARALAWIVDGIALLVPIALWSAWFTPGHRRVGDWVAGHVRRAPRRGRRAYHAEWLELPPVVAEAGVGGGRRSRVEFVWQWCRWTRWPLTGPIVAVAALTVGFDVVHRLARLQPRHPRRGPGLADASDRARCWSPWSGGDASASTAPTSPRGASSS